MKEAVIELTGYCPLNCMHCSSRKFLEGQYRLTPEQVKGVIDGLNILGVDEVCFSGGEPLSYSGLDEVLDYTNKELDSKITIYTSGFGDLQEPMREERMKELKDLGSDKLVFSLHGVSSSLNLEIAGQDQSIKIPMSLHEFISSGGLMEPDPEDDRLDKLENIIKLSKENDFETGIHSVVMKPNMYDMDNIASFSENLGVEYLSFLRYVPQGIFHDEWKRSDAANKFYEILEPNKEDLHYIENKLIELYRKYEDEEMDIKIGDPWRSPKIRKELNLPLECKAAEDVIEVTYGGEVVPCPALKWIDEYNMGNIKDKPFLQIMRSSNKKKRDNG